MAGPCVVAAPVSEGELLLDTAELAERAADGTGLAAVVAAPLGVWPTKIFVGGISRRTTTKQLRDHFSKYGAVLDCVAMRQPDGRPRGFGYVTLDSPASAEDALRDPQTIDGRVVDLKP